MKQFSEINALRTLVTKAFARWMRKNGVCEHDLMTALDEMRGGLVDADLGGHVFKKRVALQGRGKRAGARTIVATRWGPRWIYLYGFEKSERTNISSEELKSLQKLAKILLDLSTEEIDVAIEAGDLVELRGIEA